MASQVGPVDHNRDSGEQSRNAPSRGSGAEAVPNPQADEFFKRFKTGMRWPKPSQEGITAALEAIQRVGLEADVENVVNSTSMQREPWGRTCTSCGAQNREANKFCGLCGAHLIENKASEATGAEPLAIASPGANAHFPASNGQHHYYHHYHHHFFAAASESGYPETNFAPRLPGERPTKEVAPVRAPLSGPAISRAEASIRKLTQDFALACNTQQLDDLVEVYAPDAMVLRPNTPPVRGSAAIREFFFGLLDSGLSEVELEPLRVEIVGDMAYEAGRCKMLVPFAVSKRREERGKYLMVYNRRSSGEWKIMVDCWSSDLSLSVMTEPEPAQTSASPRPGIPRKSA